MANYLIIRVEQHASGESYPYLEQQNRIRCEATDSVMDDFPFQEREQEMFREAPNCATAYVCIALAGTAPTEEQLHYLRTVRTGWPARVEAYEVLDQETFEQRQPNWPKSYYYWSHDESGEIPLHEATALV